MVNTTTIICSINCKYDIKKVKRYGIGGIPHQNELKKKEQELTNQNTVVIKSSVRLNSNFVDALGNVQRSGNLCSSLS